MKYRVFRFRPGPGGLGCGPKESRVIDLPQEATPPASGELVPDDTPLSGWASVKAEGDAAEVKE